jgi:hypothetical protein
MLGPDDKWQFTHKDGREYFRIDCRIHQAVSL